MVDLANQRNAGKTAPFLQNSRVQTRAVTGVSAAMPMARGGLTPWQCRNVAAHIDVHFTHTVRIEDLASLAGLSTSHFSRVFKATFGETPYSFIIGKRIARAQMLMLTTEEPLSRIALDCGLSDQAHLSNLFRRCMGMTPNGWRLHNRPSKRHIV
jgi:AraC-like DNA-binding protein